MSNYLFIESRDAYDSADTAHFFDLVAGTVKNGNHATLYLIQNGVLAARDGARESQRLSRIAQRGVVVVADSFSLRERGIDRVADGVAPADIGMMVDLLLTPDVKALWH